MLSVRNMRKSFAGVTALKNVSMDCDRGLTAIVGDNGAGKSTLMKILAGVISPDEGSVLLDGEPVVMRSPTQARHLGIESLYQDLRAGRHVRRGGQHLPWPGDHQAQARDHQDPG